jgi:hypothetical protein
MRAFVTLCALLIPSAVFAQLSPPELLQPEDGGWRWIDDHQAWSEVTGAVQYRAQIETLGGDFSTPVADTLITETYWYVRVWTGFYQWRVAAYDGEAWSDWSEVWTFESRFPVSNEPGATTQQPVALERVSPNPAPGFVHVRFHVRDGGDVSLRVYDALGREVARLHDGTTAGVSEVRWDARALPAGTYFVVLRSGAHLVSKPVVLVN